MWISLFNRFCGYHIQISGLMHSPSTQNWLNTQSNSSGLIVKRTLRIDIPVDQYPSVCTIIYFLILLIMTSLHHVECVF